jgi:hypothetical protein
MCVVLDEGMGCRIVADDAVEVDEGRVTVGEGVVKNTLQAALFSFSVIPNVVVVTIAVVGGVTFSIAVRGRCYDGWLPLLESGENGKGRRFEFGAQNGNFGDLALGDGLTEIFLHG